MLSLLITAIGACKVLTSKGMELKGVFTPLSSYNHVLIYFMKPCKYRQDESDVSSYHLSILTVSLKVCDSGV